MALDGTGTKFSPQQLTGDQFFGIATVRSFFLVLKKNSYITVIDWIV